MVALWTYKGHANVEAVLTKCIKEYSFINLQMVRLWEVLDLSFPIGVRNFGLTSTSEALMTTVLPESGLYTNMCLC